MENRSDVVSVDELWDILDKQRKEAWNGVRSDPGSESWNVAAGKIETINNICGEIRHMNCAKRSSAEEEKRPIWKEGNAVIHSVCANGKGETKINCWAAWVCPICGWFVGEQFIPHWAKNKANNQQKCNFCSRCGQKIDWKSIEVG